MNLADIRDLYAYNRWANLRMFSVLEKLSHEQFAASVQSSFPSIHESVFHIFAAEWIWLKRWMGASPVAIQPVTGASFETWRNLRSAGEPPPQDVHTIAALKDSCGQLDRDREEFLESLTEASLQAPVSFNDMSGKPYSEPLVHLMQHVVNHGTYHRGQVTTLLRQAGAETISLDMLYFFREQQDKAAVATRS